MNVIVLVGLLCVALFVGAFITKRRFGLLGLALAAGALLSDIWGYDAGLLLNMVGIDGNTSLAQAMTQSIIVLLPAVLLLFHGQAYKSLVGRVFGAICFTLLAGAFLVEPLEHILVLQGLGADIYALLLQYRTVIVGVGLVLAVFDIFISQPAHRHSEKHSKH